MKQLRCIPFVICMLLAAFGRVPVAAQTDEPPPDAFVTPIPLVHTVQEGENLTFIAGQYGVSVAELLRLNNLADDALLAIGQELVIPGGEGDVVATSYASQVGDSIQSVAKSFNTTPMAVAEANRLVTIHYELTVGQSLSVLSRTGSSSPRPVGGTPHVVAPGETLLMVAARYGLPPAAVAAANDLPFPITVFAGQRLRIPGQAPYRYLPGAWVEVQVGPLPLVQGNTAAIYVESLQDGWPQARLAGQPIHFVPKDTGFVGLVGLDAFTEPGLYPLDLAGSGNQPWQPFRQWLPVESAGYGLQQIVVPETLEPLLDPRVREDEDAFLAPIYSTFSESQHWQGLFQIPITSTIVTAGYGDSRSYNNGPVEGFHTGVDYGAAGGTPVFAPADGRVVFSDMLQLRGNTVIVDHGLGVMSAFFHLADRLVEVGDTITVTQQIATVGSTGLSSGPHLHWDLRIMNVPVDARQWTQHIFP